MTDDVIRFAGAGGGDDGGGGGYIAPNSIFSNATLRVLDLVSEGQVGGLVDGARSIFFNDVPLQNKNGSYNFDSIQIDGVTGTPHQRVLKDYGDVVTPKNVGIEVKQNLPVVVAIDNPEADLIRPVVHLTSLSESDNKGNINETSVSFRFELAINDEGDWQLLGDFSISGKQNSVYQKGYEFKLPKVDKNGKRPRQWLLKMTRLSKDSDEHYQARTYFNSVFIVMYSRLNYPNSAIVGIKANAKNLGTIPRRSYLIDGMMLQIPSNYDPKTNTYEGIWDGSFKYAVSSNPAWILYGLLTNKRWGLGDYISPAQVNKARLYEIGRYCDEEVDDGFGRKEKRFTINTQIRERSAAYRLIGDICAVFRGMAFWANGLADVTCDKPTDPSMVYTPSNVINGLFSYSSSAKNDRHSVCLVTWNDPEQNYRKVVEYVEDQALIEKYGVRQAEFSAFGCTSRGQAIRAGRWLLYTENFETNIVTFSVGLDSSLVMPGDIIKILDPVYSGKRMGGRLIEIAKDHAIIDQEVALTPSNESVFSVRLPDGTFVDRDIIVPFEGKFNRIDWNEPLEDIPVDNSVWMISEKTLVPQLARVVNVEQGEGKATYKITAVMYEPRKYDLIEKGIQFEERPTSIVDPYEVSAPDHLNVEERKTDLENGFQTSKLLVTWLPTSPAMSYIVRWKVSTQTNPHGEWHTETVTTPAFGVDKVVNGIYTFQVQAVGMMGNKSEVVEVYYKTSGKYLTPYDVRKFYIIKRPAYLELHWDEVKDAYAYEVRWGDSWDDGKILTTGFKGTTLVHYQNKAGVYKYHIRSITGDGNYSPNVTTTVLDLKAPKTPEDLTAVVHESRIDFFWKRNTEDDINYYELREGLTWSSGVKVAESKVSQMSIPSGSKARRKFWLKAIALPKIYSDEAAWVEINIEPDQGKNIILSYDGRQFGWEANKVGIERKGDDLVIKPNVFHGEYIKKCILPGEINALNSFYSQVSAMSRTVTDDINWQQAKFAWDSSSALRAWRLGGEGNRTAYENQIALKRGLNSGEYDVWSLDENLKSQLGVEPVEQKHVKFEWGRYTKGLHMSDSTLVRWNVKSFSKKGGNFKFSFWYKPDGVGKDTSFTILQFGNERNELSINYVGGERIFKLVDKAGREIRIEYDISSDEMFFIGVAQKNDKRTFTIGSLNGKIVVENSNIAPIGDIDFIKVGAL